MQPGLLNFDILKCLLQTIFNTNSSFSISFTVPDTVLQCFTQINLFNSLINSCDRYNL